MNYNANIDTLEVEKFSSLAAQWWEPTGPCAPLHVLNPCRLQFIQAHVKLENKKVLDVGCGAGILTESLASAGAIVTGLDASAEIINVAKAHAAVKQLAIDYHIGAVEDFIPEHSAKFDIVTCMELIEHVPNPSKLIQDCAQLLKPGGKLFVSTLNRTPKAYALAIIGAEYLFKILPKQTHDYKKFIRPAELAQMLSNANTQLADIKGIKYQPFIKSASICTDVSVNYLVYAEKEI